MSWCWTTVAPMISAGKDVIVAIAAAVTAGVAILGLKKWQQELYGKANFEVARGLAKAAFNLRSQIASARSTVRKGSEFPADYDERSADPRAHAKAYAHLFQARWAPVSQALVEFQAQALEAEALWGGEFVDLVNELRRCAHTLLIAMEAVIDDQMAGGDHFRADPKFAQLMRSQLYAASKDESNALTRDVARVVTAIEAKLRPHLARRK